VSVGSIVRTASTSVAWNWTIPNRSRRSRLAQSLEQLPARPILRASESVRQVVPDGSVCRASVCASTVAVGPMTGSHQAMSSESVRWVPRRCLKRYIARNVWRLLYTRAHESLLDRHGRIGRSEDWSVLKDSVMLETRCLPSSGTLGASSCCEGPLLADGCKPSATQSGQAMERFHVPTMYQHHGKQW
jgi:hypothetical protein